MLSFLRKMFGGVATDVSSTVPDIHRLQMMGDGEGLAQALRYTDSHVIRTRAAEALGSMGGEIAVGPLVTALADEVVDVRCAAADALGVLKSAAALAPLINLLGDKSGHVRLAAANALGVLMDVRAFDSLVLCLRDEWPKVRISVALSIAGIGHSKAVHPLVETIARDDNKDVREASVKALGTLPDDLIVCEFQKALARSNTEHRQHIAEALWPLVYDRRHPSLIPLAISLLSDDDHSVRWHAVSALAHCRDASAIRHLGRRLGDKDEGIREKALKSLSWGSEFKPETDEDRVWLAISRREKKVLEAYGSLTIGPLATALNVNCDYQVVALAAEILSKTGDKQFIQPIVEAMIKNVDKSIGSPGEALIAMTRALLSLDAGPVAVGPLLSKKGGYEYVTQVRDCLAIILQQAAGQIPEDELRILGAVKDFEGSTLYYAGQPEVAVEGVSVIDCTEIRSLAAAELKRRSSAVDKPGE